MAANSSLETLTPFSLQKKYLDNSRHHTSTADWNSRAQESKYYDSARSMVIKSAHALRTPVLITKSKLRTMQCIMLGYATCAKAYRLLNRQQTR
ncbi:hypothetical protein BASA83_013255 [Batrachochytrium salamandrivorans]|nr:hypothetical protein BASA83_013255 [Batrachochytrium salamandrivorans]